MHKTNVMRILIFFLLFTRCVPLAAQADTSRWLRAFPITDYMVELNDSVKVVQLEMPDGMRIPEKQLGLVWGVYKQSKADAVQKGYGRCHLVKGDYYYFAIGKNTSGLPLQKGDLLYTFMDKTPVYYGNIPQLAGHFIRLHNVYDEPFYDRYQVFRAWTEQGEKELVDSMVADIRFTGNHFLENDPSVDKPIKSGDYQGKTTLQVMAACRPADLEDFFGYVLVKPRNYAGREWKISEIFATWLSEGAPKKVRE